MANSMNDVLHMRQTGRKRLVLSSGFFKVFLGRKRSVN
ncbi:hypothetical protein BTURTLESOX_1870 [bacterium endosymbiont of Bathymodiolus sp. 5 South]|nr:hypothetical protein BTURTLESOX_1870 [bacterium endosymbiont of Bathymodiolus sp. 5 South]